MSHSIRVPFRPAALIITSALLLTACASTSSPPAPVTQKPTPAPTATTSITGRVVIPLSFLDPSVTLQSLYAHARVWLIDGNGTATTSAPITDTGSYSIALPANTPGLRLVAIFGSAQGAPTLSTALPPLSATLDLPSGLVNLTLESTVLDEINRDPALSRAANDQLQVALNVQAGPHLNAGEVNAAGFAYVGADLSSVADGTGSLYPQAMKTTALRPQSIAEVCKINFFGFIKAFCTNVPDIVLRVKKSGSSALQPSEIVARVPGAVIAKKVTYEHPEVLLKLVDSNGKSGVQLTGVNGIIAAGSYNIIAAGSGNIIAAGSGNIIAAGSGNIIAAGAFNEDAYFTHNVSKLVSDGYALQPGESIALTPQARYANAAIIAAGSFNLIAHANAAAALQAAAISSLTNAWNYTGLLADATRAAAYKAASTTPAITDPGSASERAKQAAQYTLPGTLRLPTIVSVSDTSGDTSLHPGGQAIITGLDAASGYTVFWHDERFNQSYDAFQPDAQGRATLPVPASFQSGTIKVYLAHYDPNASIILKDLSSAFSVNLSATPAPTPTPVPDPTPTPIPDPTPRPRPAPTPTVSTTFIFTSVSSPAGTFTDFTQPISVSSLLALKGAVTAGTTDVAKVELRLGMPGGTSTPVPGASIDLHVAAGTTSNVELKDVNVAQLGPGSYPVFLRAYDAAGATVGESQGLTFVVAPPAPPAQTGSTVVAWGFDAYRETDVPTNLTNVKAIAAGGLHSLALKDDGTVVAWGSTLYGQTNVPAGLTNIKAIAAGQQFSLALKGDGTVVVWGSNLNGQFNVPAGLTNVKAIAGGGGHVLALKNDGTVVAWGYNEFGQTNVPAGVSTVTAIAAGYGHSLALKTDGTVVAWGNNNYGQSNVPAGLTNVKAIAAGFQHSLALKTDGTVVTWGNNDYGQSKVPAGLTNVKAIAAGDNFSLALKTDGTVVAWGNNEDGESKVPAGLTSITAISGGGHHSLALRVGP